MRLVLAIPIGFLGACTFGRLDGLTGGNPDAGAPEDAGSPTVLDAADARVTPVEAGPTTTTIFSADFESGERCTGGSYNSTLSTTDQKPHGGALGCRVCIASTSIATYSYSMELEGQPVVVGASYHAKVWFRRPTSGATSDSVAFALRTVTRDPFTEIETKAAFAEAKADWTMIEVELPVTKPAEALNFYLSQNSGTDYCFVLDDLEITRLP